MAKPTAEEWERAAREMQTVCEAQETEIAALKAENKRLRARVAELEAAGQMALQLLDALRIEGDIGKVLRDDEREYWEHYSEGLRAVLADAALRDAGLGGDA